MSPSLLSLCVLDDVTICYRSSLSNNSSVLDFLWQDNQWRLLKNQFQNKSHSPCPQLFYVAAGAKKRQTACWLTFVYPLHVFEVSDGSSSVLSVECTDLIFIEPWVKVNGGYYCNVLLSSCASSCYKLFTTCLEASSHFSKSAGHHTELEKLCTNAGFRFISLWLWVTRQ